MPSNYSDNLKYYYRGGRASFSSDYHAYAHLPEITLTIKASHEACCANPQYMIDNGHVAAKGSLYNLGFYYMTPIKKKGVVFNSV